MISSMHVELSVGVHLLQAHFAEQYFSCGVLGVGDPQAANVTPAVKSNIML